MPKEVSELPVNESTTEITDHDYNDRNEYVYSDKDGEESDIIVDDPKSKKMIANVPESWQRV